MEKTNRKVSVIMPAYNSERFIKKAIDSVIGQTYKDLELIIVDDCSKDSTVQIIKDYAKKDSRIKFYQQKENSGTAKTRNLGLSKSEGRFIAYLDADDFWLENKLEKQINFLETNNYCFTCCEYEKIKEDETSLNKIIHMPVSVNYDQLLSNTIILTSCVMIDTKYINKELLIMPDLKTSEDTATWLQVLKHGFVMNGQNETLAKYRVFSGSSSANKFNAVRRVWYMYRKIEKLSLLKSIKSFTGYAFHAVLKRIYIKNPFENK